MRAHPDNPRIKAKNFLSRTNFFRATRLYATLTLLSPAVPVQHVQVNCATHWIITYRTNGSSLHNPMLPSNSSQAFTLLIMICLCQKKHVQNFTMIGAKIWNRNTHTWEIPIPTSMVGMCESIMLNVHREIVS